MIGTHFRCAIAALAITSTLASFEASAQTEPSPAVSQPADPGSVDAGGPEDLGDAGELDNTQDFDGMDDFDDLDAMEELDGVPGGRPAMIRGFKGFVSNETKIYPVERDTSGNTEQNVVEAEAELDLALHRNLSVLLRPWFLIDALDTDLVRYEPLEAYVEVGGSRADLRVGQFVESWGIADTFNPIDVLNRPDLGVDALDPPSLGELGVRARYHFDGGSVIGQPSVALYAMPVWRSTPFPTDSSRFAFSQSGADVRADDFERPGLADAALAAVRMEHTLDTSFVSADLQYIAARGPQRMPAFVPGMGASGPTLTPEYYGAWVWGGGLRAIPSAPWWSKLTFKTEFVFKQPYLFEDAVSERPESSAQYAVGFDRVFAPFFGRKDSLTATLEYVGEQGADDLASQLRPFDNDLIVRVFWEANNFARASVELRSIVDLGHGDLISEAILKSQLRFVHDDLSLLIGGQLVRPSADDQSFLSFFPDNSNVRAQLRFDY